MGSYARHPNYQIWWDTARAYHRNEPVQIDEENNMREIAVSMLGMIGVAGEPPAPSIEFENLENKPLNAAWLAGALFPVSCKGLVGMLIHMLPKETLQEIGTILVDQSLDNPADERVLKYHQLKALEKLAMTNPPGLDCYPEQPIVAVSPYASARDIERSASQLSKECKEKFNISETRNRSEKHQEYFQVFDLREGWENGQYDRTKELKFKEIAESLNISIPTAQSHYSNSFELITGHSYSPEVWCVLFGPLKITELVSGDLARVSGSRPLVSKRSIAVPDSVVSHSATTESSASSLVNSMSNVEGDNDLSFLMSDIQSLISTEMTDEEITQELGSDVERFIEAVAYLRNRNSE